MQEEEDVKCFQEQWQSVVSLVPQIIWKKAWDECFGVRKSSPRSCDCMVKRVAMTLPFLNDWLHLSEEHFSQPSFNAIIRKHICRHTVGFICQSDIHIYICYFQNYNLIDGRKSYSATWWSCILILFQEGEHSLMGNNWWSLGQVMQYFEEEKSLWSLHCPLHVPPARGPAVCTPNADAAVEWGCSLRYSCWRWWGWMGAGGISSFATGNADVTMATSIMMHCL